MRAEKRNILEVLRQKAEKLFEGKTFAQNVAENAEVQKLFHELQIQQLELEMQNDELSIVTAELELQRTRFANLFQLAPVGYLVLNSSGIITDINTTGCKILGLRKELLYNRLLATFVHPNDIASFSAFLCKILTSKTEQNCQLQLFRVNKDVFYGNINGICVNGNNQENTCYLTLADITDKKLSELEVQRAKKRLEVALNASLTAIWEIELASGRVFLDNFGKAIFGFTNNHFDGSYSTLLNFINEDDRAKVDAAIRRAMVSNKELNVDFGITDKNGENKYLNARGQVQDNGDQHMYLIGTLTDITEKKRMELETLRLKEAQQAMITAAALQAEENEKKRVSETLHDSIGQMLYGIKLNLQQYKDTPTKEYLDHINDLLNQTIRDVRNISFELAPSILKDFGLAATLEEMSNRLSNSNLSIQLNIKNTGNIGLNTSLNIFRIVQELVNNSLKHSGANKITIDIGKKNSLICVCVKDNGKGFDYVQVTKGKSGSGLSSIRNRITLYKGSIDICAEPGKGAAITIKLKQ